MDKKTAVVASLGLMSLIAGFLVLLEQYLVFGVWFQIQDIHHETIAMALFALPLGILMGFLSARTKK